MLNRFGRIAFVTAAMLAGCVNPETECRSGLGSLKTKLDAVVGYTEHPDVNALMAQARAQYDQALGERDAGDFEGCRVSLEQGEIFLDKAKRIRLDLAK